MVPSTASAHTSGCTVDEDCGRLGGLPEAQGRLLWAGWRSGWGTRYTSKAAVRLVSIWPCSCCVSSCSAPVPVGVVCREKDPALASPGLGTLMRCRATSATGCCSEPMVQSTELPAWGLFGLPSL